MGLSKHDYAVRTAACLAYLMLQQQDSVGLVTFDTKVRRYIPPRARPRHMRADYQRIAGNRNLGTRRNWELCFTR